jgi:hypothetical protein
MPIGWIVSWVYYSKKAPSKTNPLGRSLGFLWAIIGINILILGFFFGSFLTTSLIPIILILLGIGIFVSGGIIRVGLLIFSGIILNISGLVCFYLDSQDHPLIMGIAAILAILIPGLLLKLNSKKENV